MTISRLINHPTFGNLQKLVTLLASLAVVVGIFFAAIQVRISTEIDRRQTTLNILTPTRDEAVLLALQRLQIAKELNKPFEEILTERVVLDRNLILNTYDSVAIYYQFGTMEKCIVKAHVREALDLVIDVLEYSNVPANACARITRLRTDLNALKCSTN